MFDEPDESDTPAERASDPASRAREKFDEFRMHAELAAVFEGPRKFGAKIVAGLDPELAREFQRGVARLEKAKSPDSPLLTEPAAVADAARMVDLPLTSDLPAGDYHIHRRPGEVMILKWLDGDGVETFYQRFQAHFDAALKQYREEERQAHGWRQDAKTTAYLDALDAIQVRMADRYLRDVIRQHKLFVLSTQTADEIDILHLCDFIMGVPAIEVVGRASAPPEDQPAENDRAWFFKLFSLRGMRDGAERMCFFTYLQKSDDADW